MSVTTSAPRWYIYIQNISFLGLFCIRDLSFHVGWLRLVGSLKLYVSLENIGLFYRALLQKRPILSRSILIVATPLYQRPVGAGAAAGMSVSQTTNIPTAAPQINEQRQISQQPRQHSLEILKSRLYSHCIW